MPADPERLAIDHVAQRLSRQFTDLDTDLVAWVANGGQLTHAVTLAGPMVDRTCPNRSTT